MRLMMMIDDFSHQVLMILADANTSASASVAARHRAHLGRCPRYDETSWSHSEEVWNRLAVRRDDGRQELIKKTEGRILRT